MDKHLFNLLGDFQYVSRDGSREEIDLAKNIGLIAILTLSKDHSCSRSRLIDLLWSDRCNEQGRASLRHSLWSLKQVFGDDAGSLLQADRKRVRLNPDVCVMDTAEFVRLSGAFESRDLEHAVSFYRGELLEGLFIRDRQWNEWLAIERESLNSRFLSVLAELCEIYRRQGAPRELIETGRRMVEYDFLSEPGYQAMMQGYLLSNQRSQALKQFQRYASLIKRELNSSPGPEISALHDRIKNGGLQGGYKADQSPKAMPTGEDWNHVSWNGSTLLDFGNPQMQISVADASGRIYVLDQAGGDGFAGYGTGRDQVEFD